MFDDVEVSDEDEDGYFDDFEESMASKQENEFNANELLNF